uniref:pentapeptide repeat-containing protein n=1 Tax=Micromonospora tulbaghiae TaxID=479978 RepID=UPI003EBEE378
VGASLRNANLDNANLEYADLSGADLEGVRLEETSTVVGLTVLDNDCIVAGYDDRSIRMWRRNPGGQWGSQIVGLASHAIERIQVTPGGRLLVLGGNELSVLSPEGSGWVCDTRFATKPTLRPPVAGPTTMLYEEELPGGVTGLTWTELTTRKRYRFESADEPSVCYAQLDGRAFAVASESGVQLALPVEGGADVTAQVELRSVNCMDMRSLPQGEILLVCGHRDGHVTLSQYKPGGISVRWRSRRHEAMITSVVFVDDDYIVSGGIDRSVKVTTVAAGVAPDEEPIMRLTLRCAGVKYDSVQTERERQMLAAAVASGPGPARL